MVILDIPGTVVQTNLRRKGLFHTSSVNLDACEPSWEGCDLPSTSGRWGGVSGAGLFENGPCSVTGVLAGLGRMTGIPLSGR